MRTLTKEWVDRVEGDHQAASTLRAAPTPVLDAVCFHCQQTAEKYLKAWLPERQISFPRTHDLEALARRAMPTLVELASLLPELRFLTSFAVEIRYPGTVALESDADRCLAAANDLRALVRLRLGL